MENLQIGQWLLNNDGIEWIGMPYTGYFIRKDDLLRPSMECIGCYDWLLHLAHKNWLAEEDIHALNTAFIFALERFEPNYRRKALSMKQTLTEQYHIIQYKNSLPNKGMVWKKLFEKRKSGSFAGV